MHSILSNSTSLRICLKRAALFLSRAAPAMSAVNLQGDFFLFYARCCIICSGLDSFATLIIIYSIKIALKDNINLKDSYT